MHPACAEKNAKDLAHRARRESLPKRARAVENSNEFSRAEGPRTSGEGYPRSIPSGTDMGSSGPWDSPRIYPPDEPASCGQKSTNPMLAGAKSSGTMSVQAREPAGWV